MELTKSKLHKIIKKYKQKLDQHDHEWDEICKRKHQKTDLGDGRIKISTPSIFDHERHNSKGAQLFRQIMKEFDGYDIFPTKN